MKYHTSGHIQQLLRAACKLAGSQQAWADKNGLSSPYVSDVLLGRREPGESILRVLGYERLMVYRKKESNDASREKTGIRRLKKTECSLKEREKNLAKNRIRGAVSLAIKGEVLIRGGCERCKKDDTTSVGHHDDYNFPLDVRWLCNRCHRQWHAENNPVEPEEKMLSLSNYECLRLGLSQHPEIDFPLSLIKRDARKQRKRKQVTGDPRCNAESCTPSAPFQDSGVYFASCIQFLYPPETVKA